MSFIWQLFTDPLLRGPLLGTLSLGISSGIMGSFMYLKRQNLIAETLSHTAYPGVALALSALALAPIGYEARFGQMAATAGALALSWLGLIWLRALEQRGVRQDAALCWVLSASMGIGVLIASRLQTLRPSLYQQVQNSLYGQSATITDAQSLLMALFALICILFTCAVRKELMALYFDRQFARVAGLHAQSLEICVALLTSLAVIIGIKGGGIVLTTGLMVTPVAAARPLTNGFFPLVSLAALIGALSAFGGIGLSIWLEIHFQVPVPAGPVMVLLGGILALLTLIFSPKSGLALRLWRRWKFQYRCSEENLLKAALRRANALSIPEVMSLLGISKWGARRLLSRLDRKGLLLKSDQGSIALSSNGHKRACYITRLHRLWELYLTQCFGIENRRVHASAEQIEHVITPQIERQLTRLLENPQLDPHNRAIPPLTTS